MARRLLDWVVAWWRTWRIRRAGGPKVKPVPHPGEFTPRERKERSMTAAEAREYVNG